MMKIFNLQKLSRKMAAFVILTTLIVAGTTAFYFESRIITLYHQYVRADLMSQVNTAIGENNTAITEAIYTTASIRSLAETAFDVNEYRLDAEGYFETITAEVMGDFVYNIIDRSDFLMAAYFAVHPDLAGRPLVREVYFEASDYGVITGEPQSYQEYKQVDSEEMVWFYGAYDSGEPYWTYIHEYEGELTVSYVEPVIIGNIKVGVAGVDISINHIAEDVKSIKLFDSGFALLKDNRDIFLETNDYAVKFNGSEKSKLLNAASSSDEPIFEVELDDIHFMVAHAGLLNNYFLYFFVPEKEYSAEIVASTIKFAVIFPIILIIVAFVASFTGAAIARPLVHLSQFMSKAGKTGDLKLSQADIENIEKYSKAKDEIGQTIASAAEFVKHVTDVSDVLETIASGDLTVNVEPVSELDVMGNSLVGMAEKLNEVFCEIKGSTQQVSAGAKQVADGSQTLAQGASEQAASIEELSASVADMAEKTKSNAALAENAEDLANTIKEKAEKGSRHMDEMISAVNEINEASSSIKRVIKVIDDIAFQTNILALNAAVEAARAGQHGKGFAVVAEEVRNLAARSAEAAKETGSLIENSVAKANLGVRIANETAESLTEIVSGINESSKLISEIAKSSDEQSLDIQHFNTSIDQVANVVTKNSATAEESSAASEEMSSQSALLEEYVSRFKLKPRSAACRGK